MPRRARERLQWNVLDDSITEEKGSSTDGEQMVSIPKSTFAIEQEIAALIASRELVLILI